MRAACGLFELLWNSDYLLPGIPLPSTWGGRRWVRAISKNPNLNYSFHSYHFKLKRFLKSFIVEIENDNPDQANIQIASGTPNSFNVIAQQQAYITTLQSSSNTTTQWTYNLEIKHLLMIQHKLKYKGILLYEEEGTLLNEFAQTQLFVYGKLLGFLLSFYFHPSFMILTFFRDCTMTLTHL